MVLESDVLEFLLSNREHIQEKIRKHNLVTFKPDPCFLKEFNLQLLGYLREQIVDEVTNNLACDAEIVYLVLEELDMEEYLNGIYCTD